MNVIGNWSNSGGDDVKESSFQNTSVGYRKRLWLHHVPSLVVPVPIAVSLKYRPSTSLGLEMKKGIFIFGYVYAVKEISVLNIYQYYINI